MSDFELSKSLSPHESVDEYRSECMGMRKEKDSNLRDVEVGRGMEGDSVAPPTKQARPEYLWENFPNEFGDQWQSLGPDDHRPHSSPEKTSDKYLSEQGSKQLRSSSDMVYRSFKAGSSGFRSYEDYKKAVENHSKWWNKMNAKRSMWMSRERIVNCADQDTNSKPQSLIEDPESYSSTDSSSSDGDAFEKYPPDFRGKSGKSSGNKFHANFESPTPFAQWRDESARVAKKLGIRNGSPEDYLSAKMKKGSSPCNNGHRMKLPVEAISRNPLGQTKISRDPDQQKKQKSRRASTIHPPSVPVPNPRSSKSLQSGSDSRGSRQKRPISGRKKLESFKTIDGAMSRSRNGSNSSKQSPTSGKRELESFDSMNLKSDTRFTAPGTGRKKWIKTPMKEKMSLRSKSTRRLLPITSYSDCFSEESDSSSFRRWNTVLRSAEVNGLLKADASSNSSSKRKDKAGDLFQSKLEVFGAKKFMEDSHEKSHKRKDASKLKSEVKLDSVPMETIIELQKELASLKLSINSKKKMYSLISRDSLASSDYSSRGRRVSSPQGACSETCSLITAFLPILFSHDCYSKKRQMFEEYNQRQWLSSHAESNAPMKIPESNLLADGLDGKTKAVYVIHSLPTDQNARNTTCQQKDKSASPKLLSYRSVEQIPNEKPKSKPTIEKSTQTEFSVPVMNFEPSDKLRSVGTQCNKEDEMKLMENTCGRIDSRPTIWQFGPDNAMGVTFKSTCNVMEIPCSSFQRLQKNKQKSKEEQKSKEPKLIISPVELQTVHGVVEKLSGKVSDRAETRKETARELEDESTTLKGNSCQTFSQKISIELPEDSWKSLPRRSQDSVSESIDEVDEQEQKSLSKGPSKKKSKLMTHSPLESAVESKEENATRQKTYQSFSGPSCNASKKFCHRRRLLKSVAKPTPFKFTKSE